MSGAAPDAAIAAKDYIGWLLTFLGLLFVFLYSKSRMDRAARETGTDKFRDLLIETESAVLASLKLPGSDLSQMERYIEINSKMKRLQGCVIRLKSLRNGENFTPQFLDLKRIATGGDAQSMSRPPAGDADQRAAALSVAMNGLLELVDGYATKKHWWG